MVDGQTILSAIEKDLATYQQKFDDIQVEIQQTEEKLVNLKAKKEQIRGAFTSLYKYYESFSENKPEEVIEETTTTEETALEEDSKTIATENLEVKEPEKSTSKSDDESDNKLSPEEQQKIMAQLNKSKTSKPQVKEEDIPDYLKSEYSK